MRPSPQDIIEACHKIADARTDVAVFLFRGKIGVFKLRTERAEKMLRDGGEYLVGVYQVGIRGAISPHLVIEDIKACL